MSEQAAAPTSAAPAAEATSSAPVESSSGEELSSVEEGSESEEQALESEVENAEEAIDNDPNLSKKEKIELKKKLKLKVDGQEFEEEVDLSDEDYLRKQLQLAKVAQRRMQETAQIRKEIEQFAALLKEDPDAALMELGIDPLDYAEKRLAREIEQRKKSPEQLEKEQMQRELEKLRKQMESEQKAKEEAKIRAMEEQFQRKLDDEISSALDASKDLPKSPYVVKRIADRMIFALQNGVEDIEVKDVIPQVRKQIKSELGEMFSAMPEEVLEGLLGKGNIDRLRKRRLVKAKDGAKIQNAKQIKNSGLDVEAKAAKDSDKDKIPMRDFFKNLK